MSNSVSNVEAGPVPDARRSFGDGRSGLVVAALLVVLGLFLVYGTVTMEVPDTATAPGPQVFPAIVAGLCFVIAILVAAQLVRTPETVDLGVDEQGRPNTGTLSNWKSVGITVGSVALFIALLNPLGWVLAGALLFWGVSVGLGGTRYVFDAAVALLVSSVIQLAFSGGLGLTLPGGVLAQVF